MRPKRGEGSVANLKFTQIRQMNSTSFSSSQSDTSWKVKSNYSHATLNLYIHGTLQYSTSRKETRKEN